MSTTIKSSVSIGDVWDSDPFGPKLEIEVNSVSGEFELTFNNCTLSRRSPDVYVRRVSVRGDEDEFIHQLSKYKSSAIAEAFARLIGDSYLEQDF